VTKLVMDGGRYRVGAGPGLVSEIEYPTAEDPWARGRRSDRGIKFLTLQQMFTAARR